MMDPELRARCAAASFFSAPVRIVLIQQVLVRLLNRGVDQFMESQGGYGGEWYGG
jgi:hypothetical protein